MITSSLSVLALAVALGAAGPALADDDTMRGKVLAVSDGDTILVKQGGSAVSVSLADVDAPEPGQAFAEEAREFVRKATKGKKVSVEVTEWNGKRAAVGHVSVDGESLAKLLVDGGFAWSADEQLRAAEQAARQGRKGLWASTDPTPPWEYREAKAASGR